MRGLKQYRHPKTGILYTYHRATGKRLTAEPGTAEFIAELLECEKLTTAKKEDAAKPKSLGAFILAYKQSDDWKDLGKRTKQDYEKVIGFLKPAYNQPISMFTAPQIASMRDKWRKQRGRRFVNYCLTILTLVIDRAVEAGELQTNTAKQVKRIRRDKNIEPMNRPWSERERWAAWQHTGQERYRHLRLPLAIGMYLGLREGDMLKLPRTILKNNQLELQTAKRKVWIDLMVLPELAEAARLAAEHDAITLCANSRGRPWTQDGFRTSFFKMIKEMENQGLVDSGLTYHGLRHTVASLLAEHEGVSNEDVAAVLGQKSSKIAAHYSERADRKRRASATISKLQPLRQVKK
jgi:integrase